MFKMIRQFTFHHPKQIIAPTLWLFLSQAFSILPAILAYMAIYLLGQAFYPPYTLDIALLIKIAVIGIAYVLLQYVVELISYYNTYGRAYHDTADKRIAYIQKLRRQSLGFFSSKESGELISSFASDFANVEFTMCYWLPYPIGVGFLLLLSFVCMLFFDWRMAVAIFAMLPVCAILMLQIAKVKEKHSRSVMEAKTRAATQLNEYLHGMKDLKAYHRTGSGFETLKKAFSDLRKESLRDEAVAGSLSTLCASLVKFVVPVTAMVGLYLLMGGSLTILDFAGFLVIATKLTEPALTLVSSISALRGMALSGERLDKVMTMSDPSGTDKITHGDSYAFDSVSFHYAADTNVIHGVSFETPAGALTALVGPSGSGKSTLLRLMARFWDYQHGQVRFAGKELRSIAPESLLSQVSILLHRGGIAHAFKNAVDLLGVLGFCHNFYRPGLFHLIDDGVKQDAIAFGFHLKALQVLLLDGKDRQLLAVVDQALEVGLTGELLIVVGKGNQKGGKIFRPQPCQLEGALGDLDTLTHHQVSGFTVGTHARVPPCSLDFPAVQPAPAGTAGIPSECLPVSCGTDAVPRAFPAGRQSAVGSPRCTWLVLLHRWYSSFPDKVVFSVPPASECPTPANGCAAPAPLRW